MEQASHSGGIAQQVSAFVFQFRHVFHVFPSVLVFLRVYGRTGRPAVESDFVEIEIGAIATVEGQAEGFSLGRSRQLAPGSLHAVQRHAFGCAGPCFAIIRRLYAHTAGIVGSPAVHVACGAKLQRADFKGFGRLHGDGMRESGLRRVPLRVPVGTLVAVHGLGGPSVASLARGFLVAPVYHAPSAHIDKRPSAYRGAVRDALRGIDRLLHPVGQVHQVDVGHHLCIGPLGQAEALLDRSGITAGGHVEAVAVGCRCPCAVIRACACRRPAVRMGKRRPVQVIPRARHSGVGVGIAAVGLAHSLSVRADIIFQEGVHALHGKEGCTAGTAVCGQVLPFGFALIAIPRRDEHALVLHTDTVLIRDGLLDGRGVDQELYKLSRCPVRAFFESLRTRSLVAEALDGHALTAVQGGRTLVVGQVGVCIGVAIVPHGEDDVAPPLVHLNAHIEAVLSDGHRVGAHQVMALGDHDFLIEPVAHGTRRTGRSRVPQVGGGRRQVGGQIGSRTAFLVELPVAHGAKPAGTERQVQLVPACFGEIDAVESRHIGLAAALFQTYGAAVQGLPVGAADGQLQGAGIYRATRAGRERTPGLTGGEMDVLHTVSAARVGPRGQF